MGKKKLNENPKAAEARSRKEAAASAKKDKSAKDKEDAEWAAAGEGAKSKAAAKRDAQAAERAEAAKKKAEARKLAEEEEKAMASKPNKAAKAQKMTQYQIQQQREAEAKLSAEERAKREKELKREMGEEAYAAMVDARNTNREASGDIDARSIDGALGALSVGDAEVDKNPEKRFKAAFKAYQERELPRIKEEKPRLKLMQYRELLYKEFQKSPENPIYAAQLAAEAAAQKG